MKCCNCKREAVEGRNRCQPCIDSYEKTRAKKLANGICARCTNLAVVGKTKCQSCLDKSKVEYKEFKKTGICISCRKVKAVENMALCTPCLDRIKVRNRYWFDNVILKNPHTTCSIVGCKNTAFNDYVCEYHYNLNKESKRKRWAKLEAIGLCSRCGKPVVDEGFGIKYKTCINCRERTK